MGANYGYRSRQVDYVRVFQLLLDVIDDFAVELVERAYAAEMKIVLAHYLKALTWNAAPAGNVL